jgi:WD40 repeat protein
VSADGATIVTASGDGTARVWSSTGECRATLAGHTGWIRGCAVSADGATIVTASVDGTARVWSPAGECRATLAGHTGWIRGCAVSANGATIVTASDDGTARVWSGSGALRLLLLPNTSTRVWVKAESNLLHIDGPSWPLFQLSQGDAIRGFRLFPAEAINDVGPGAVKRFANAAEWPFVPIDGSGREVQRVSDEGVEDPPSS